MNRPQANEFPLYCKGYISLVEDNVLDLLERQAHEFPDFINSLSEKADYAYAPGKWTIKELVGHIIDTERVFAYRMMCFARGEQAALPGFDENDYVTNANFSERSLSSLAEEFSMARKANLYLIKSFGEKQLNSLGIASEKQISVRAIVFVTAGHLIHHSQIIKERYL